MRVLIYAKLTNAIQIKKKRFAKTLSLRRIYIDNTKKKR